MVRNAYARRVYVDRGFQKKTNPLVQGHIGMAMERPSPYPDAKPVLLHKSFRP